MGKKNRSGNNQNNQYHKAINDNQNTAQSSSDNNGGINQSAASVPAQPPLQNTLPVTDNVGKSAEANPQNSMEFKDNPLPLAGENSQQPDNPQFAGENTQQPDNPQLVNDNSQPTEKPQSLTDIMQRFESPIDTYDTTQSENPQTPNLNAPHISQSENTQSPESSQNGEVQNPQNAEAQTPQGQAQIKKPMKFNKIRHIIAGSLLLTALIVLIVSRISRSFADWLCFNVYPVFSGIGSRIWGVFPFSVAEIFVVLVILGTLTGIVFLIIKVIKSKGNRLKAFLNGISWGEIFWSAIFLIVTLNCLVGYNRTPFSQYSGLNIRKYTADELKEMTLHLIEEADKVAEKVDLDSEGRPIKPYDFNKFAVQAMESIGEKYNVLNTYYPQPKGVAASEIMSSCNLAGIYFPVTVEANFNKAMPVSSQGFTACHELSHLSGFIREDEANYIAFIACRESESTYFKYSGYLGALTYSLNALYSSVSKEEYNKIINLLSPVIINEFSHRNSYWSPYEKQVTYKVSSIVNDKYLKANNQSDGTRSYGRMVDLMLAEYFGD